MTGPLRDLRRFFGSARPLRPAGDPTSGAFPDAEGGSPHEAEPRRLPSALLQRPDVQLRRRGLETGAVVVSAQLIFPEMKQHSLKRRAALV